MNARQIELLETLAGELMACAKQIMTDQWCPGKDPGVMTVTPQCFIVQKIVETDTPPVYGGFIDSDLVAKMYSTQEARHFLVERIGDLLQAGGAEAVLLVNEGTMKTYVGDDVDKAHFKGEGSLHGAPGSLDTIMVAMHTLMGTTTWVQKFYQGVAIDDVMRMNPSDHTGGMTLNNDNVVKH